MVDRDVPHGIFLSEHPLTQERNIDGWYFFVGCDSSDSTHRMRRSLLSNLRQDDNLTKITWHYIAQYHEGVKLGNQVVVEVETEVAKELLRDRFMCSDMTDYSGAGSEALKEMRDFLSILIECYSPVVEETYYEDSDLFVWMWQKVNQANQEQSEGEEDDKVD